MTAQIAQRILRVLEQHGPLSTREIGQVLEKNKVKVDKEAINSLLYGQLRETVVRDKDEKGYPTWRLKLESFEAAKGMEVMFYKELLRRKIITKDESQLDYPVQNKRKTYHLDIAIFLYEQKYNIEIDGYEHIRADALRSIQKQIQKKGENGEITIDWMDNRNSFVDFSLINTKDVYRWFSSHKEWCMRYHEELLKPHDISRNIWLIENGWRVIRFWNFEVKDDVERCIAEVMHFLRT